jgi:adenylylsulfate reductase, subunit A
MTSIRGLFAAGDGVGASGHKFSSGSFTEGRIAAKAAVAFAQDHPASPKPAEAAIHAAVGNFLQPMNRSGTTLDRKQAEHRLQRIMDEYVAGPGSNYETNQHQLRRGTALLALLREDMAAMSAATPHDLLRCCEAGDRLWCAETHIRHLLYREETRWPGYYVRTDFPRLNDRDWKCFVVSRYDTERHDWEFASKPCPKANE